MTYRILLVALLAAATSSAVVQHGPFTKDFVKFMQRNPQRNEYALSAYEEYGQTGTFGGKSVVDEKVTNHPVLFVHGNSDSALFFSDMATGWTESVEFFKSKGFVGFELYGLTYGSRNLTNSMKTTITCRNLIGLRRFIEVILAYTQSEKIDIVAHSMGVTLARKAVQGGMVHMTEESCDLGESMSHQVDGLVAIAGANYGMCMCLMNNLSGLPACGQEGYAPGSCGQSACTAEKCGDADAECDKDDYASILRTINNGAKEAAFIASMWSNDDAILGKGNLAWGRKTSVVPNSDYTHAYDGYNHFHMKDKTAHDQFNLVTLHRRHVARGKRQH